MSSSINQALSLSLSDLRKCMEAEKHCVRLRTVSKPYSGLYYLWNYLCTCICV
ncbi:hypothetical protein Syun_017585 [Stephania yunnanensis]|uniref:Uncharacterized protein n=1 Tax=Stephania yunnanensis TaxID=152371 RepID=A0AAP0J7A8_9MAGN